MRYRLRSLLILLAVGPPILAGIWFVSQEYKAEQVTRIEWGGAVTIPAEDSEPIEFDELESAVRDTVVP